MKYLIVISFLFLTQFSNAQCLNENFEIEKTEEEKQNLESALLAYAKADNAGRIAAEKQKCLDDFIKNFGTDSEENKIFVESEKIKIERLKSLTAKKIEKYKKEKSNNGNGKN